jgi:tRNA threonylcarbamoyladenosine modification (KEOPS) complex Cgi121 subunit
MTDAERDILRLMYDLQIELVRHQGDQIDGLKHAIDGATKAIESLERSHAIVAKLMTATGDLMRTN